MRAYSMDLRSRVLQDRVVGVPSVELAPKYQVSRSWVDRVYQRHRAGEDTPRKQTKFRTRRLAGHEERLRAIVAEQPDRTLVEIRAALGVSVARDAAHAPRRCLHLSR
jgi:transposase